MSEYRCPICKNPTQPENLFFPFCSKRCKLVDLGSWFDEKYRVSRPLQKGDLNPEVLEDLPWDPEIVEGNPR